MGEQKTIDPGEGGAHLTVGIRQAVIDGILQHAGSDAPLECCGLVLGRRHGEAPDLAGVTETGRAHRAAVEAIIERAFPARNVLASRTRFQIDPADHFAAIRAARAGGLSVVGAYHSHPVSAAVPSPRDLAEAGDPDLLYLIAGLPNMELRAYRLVGGNFCPVELVPFS